MKNRAKSHEVSHDIAGRNRHVFTVDDHTVILAVSCDCDFMGVEGIANNMSCSHILAVCGKIWKTGKINPVLSVRNNRKMETIRAISLSYIRKSNRKINEIRGSESESKVHYSKKQEICNRLISEDKKFVTEAIFESGGRADIVVLDTAEIIEIVHTEKIESLAEKWNTYPKGFKLKIERA